MGGVRVCSQRLYLLSLMLLLCCVYIIIITAAKTVQSHLQYLNSWNFMSDQVSAVNMLSLLYIWTVNTWWIPVMYRNYLCSILFYHTFSMQDILAKFLMIKCRVAFRIHFLRIRIRIQHLRMTTNPDPDSIHIQGFHDQKLKQNYSWKYYIFFFYIKNCNLPIPRPPESMSKL